MTTTEIMNLEDARAVAAILRAAETGALVARLNGVRVLTGQASWIGSPPLMRPNWAAEQKTDVRDLYLHVRDGRDGAPPGTQAWLIRDLVADYRTGEFVPDFDREAFEAAGGQAAVPARVAFEAAGGQAAVPARVARSCRDSR